MGFVRTCVRSWEYKRTILSTGRTKLQRRFVHSWSSCRFWTIHHKQIIIWKMSCSFVSNFDGWWETGWSAGGPGGSACFSFFFLLNWKNCFIISAHSDANTPRRTSIFGWNGWTGATGLSDCSEPFPPLPSGKSLQVLFTCWPDKALFHLKMWYM